MLQVSSITIITELQVYEDCIGILVGIVWGAYLEML